jgi:hypothetical protein
LGSISNGCHSSVKCLKRNASVNALVSTDILISS